MPSRILGALKVSAVLILDLSLFLSLFHSPAVAAAGVIGIGIYTFLGGYFALVQEGGVRLDKLPAPTACGSKPRWGGCQTTGRPTATAHGCGSTSSPATAICNPPPTARAASAYPQARLTPRTRSRLSAVLGHEAGHIQNLDSEFKRAVFCTVMLAVAGLSVLSAAAVLALFLLFLILSCFRSWLGLFAFHGARKASSRCSPCCKGDRPALSGRAGSGQPPGRIPGRPLCVPPGLRPPAGALSLPFRARCQPPAHPAGGALPQSSGSPPPHRQDRSIPGIGARSHYEEMIVHAVRPRRRPG